MSNLVRHAERELRLAGFFDADADYGGMLGKAVLKLIEDFAAQNHSGGSAFMARHLFAELSDFKALTPLTDRPDEWVEVGEDVWQNARQFDAFSDDGGKTYHVLTERRKWVPRWLSRRLSDRMRMRVMYPLHTTAPSGFIIEVAE